MLPWFTWIRALAAIIVIIYHLNQLLPIDGLSSGMFSLHLFVTKLSLMVSVFFFLSWFFRAFSYWKCVEAPEKVPHFWDSLKDRFFRIAPAYYIALFLSVWVTYIIGKNTDISIPAILAGLSFTTWFSPETLFPIITNWPLWFVAFDMIGWICTSLIMMGYFSFRWKNTLSGTLLYFFFIACLFLLGHFFWIYLPWAPTDIFPANYWFPIYNPFLFFLHFFFGIIAAGIVSYMKKITVQSSLIADVWVVWIWCIIMCLIWALKDVSDDFAYSFPRSPYYFPWFQILFTSLCIMLPFTRYIGGFLDNAFTGFTAKISYELFLIHMIIMSLCSHYFFRELTIYTWWILWGCVFITSYIVAYGINRMIEFGGKIFLIKK